MNKPTQLVMEFMKDTEPLVQIQAVWGDGTEFPIVFKVIPEGDEGVFVDDPAELTWLAVDLGMEFSPDADQYEDACIFLYSQQDKWFFEAELMTFCGGDVANKVGRV